MFLLCSKSVQSLVQDNSTRPTPPPQKPHIHHPSPSPCHRITSGWHHFSGALVSSGLAVIPPNTVSRAISHSNLSVSHLLVENSLWLQHTGSNPRYWPSLQSLLPYPSHLNNTKPLSVPYMVRAFSLCFCPIRSPHPHFFVNTSPTACLPVD